MKKIVLFLITFFLISSSTLAYVKTTQIDILFTLGISRDDVEIRNCGEGSFEVLNLSEEYELVGDNFKELNCYDFDVYSPITSGLSGEGDSNLFLLRGKRGVQGFYILGAKTENGSFWFSSITVPIYIVLIVGFVVLFILFLGKGFKRMLGWK